MAFRAWQLWIVLLLAGCGGKTPDPSTLVAVPGHGISNIADITMSLNSIRDEVGDLEIRSYPKSGFPWQKDIFGQRRRLPWEKPFHFTAVSRSLGLSVSSTGKDKAVQGVTFYCEPYPIAGSKGVFTGRLSGGLSFTNHRKVTRSEVVAIFGQPVRFLDQPDSLLRLTQAGTSVSFKTHTGNGLEMLFYPTNGIHFILQHDVVTAFEIRPKVQPQQSHADF